MEFDPIGLFTNTSPAIAFGVLAYYFNRRDHADMLRREEAHSTQLAAIVERQLKEAENRSKAIADLANEVRELKNQMHGVKNALQQLMPYVDPRWRSSSQSRMGGDAE